MRRQQIEKEGNKSDKNYGGFDYWVVKMDINGNIIWDKTFGGTSDDVATAVIATSDGGYLVGGTSISNKSVTKSKVSFKNSSDYWVIKLDANGNKIWDQTMGGIYTEDLTSLAELSSGKYIVGGYSFSSGGGTKKKATSVRKTQLIIGCWFLTRMEIYCRKVHSAAPVWMH